MTTRICKVNNVGTTLTTSVFVKKYILGFLQGFSGVGLVWELVPYPPMYPMDQKIGKRVIEKSQIWPFHPSISFGSLTVAFMKCCHRRRSVDFGYNRCPLMYEVRG